MNFLYVGLAGFAGAILRVGIGWIPQGIYPNITFPYPTLLINLLGSFLLAYFLIAVNNNRVTITPEMKAAIATGLLGSFTTFSTFSVEILLLFQEKAYALVMLYITLSFLGGLFFSWLGIHAATKRWNKKVPSIVRGNES